MKPKNQSNWTRPFRTVYFHPSISTRLYGPVFLDPSFWTRLFVPVYLNHTFSTFPFHQLGPAATAAGSDKKKEA